MKIDELKKKNKNLYEIALKIYQQFKKVQMIAFYGSQITGKVG